MKFWNKNKSSRSGANPALSSRLSRSEATRKDRKGKEKNNRPHFLIAIIFLLAGAILYKLCYLQIVNADYYSSLAAGQHEVFNELEPDRGRIFVEDTDENGRSQLYPLATNKDFGLLYAKPAEIPYERTEGLAAALYDFFDRENDKEEVEKLIEELKKEMESKGEKIEEEFLAMKKELDLKTLEEKGLDRYKKILAKEKDPYEPIKNKVDPEDLKKIFSSLAEKSGIGISSTDLEIKDNRVYVLKKGKPMEWSLPGFGYSLSSFRFYPEAGIGAQVTGFVGYDGDKKNGRYGLEEFFNEELSGRPGSIKTERDASGDLIIINDRQYNKPVTGSDLILTLDRNIQFAACHKLTAAVTKHGADGGAVIVMDPYSGAILAMCSAPEYDPNNYGEVEGAEIYTNSAVSDQYEPGSIYKSITMAVALDQEKVTPDTTYNDTGVVKVADYEIKNSDLKAHGITSMTTVLEQSFNTGAIYAMRQVGAKVFAEYVKNFGFGERTGIELTAEGKGDINNLFAEENNDLYAATASFGQGISVTPLQMVAAYGVIANGGNLMKPYIVKEILEPNGQKITAEPKIVRPVISKRAATLLGGMLVNVVENGHGQAAGVDGYWVAGKTGTAQVPKKDGRGYEGNAHVGSFAGYAPVDEPKFVMIVKIDRPRDVEWAESSAAPLFGEIADYILHYYQVPAAREAK